MSDTKPVEAVVKYGIWDKDFNDFVLVPGPDDYLHSTLDSLDLLKFCAGDAAIVKITIEPIAAQ